jgi:hypothetical protein
MHIRDGHITGWYFRDTGNCVYNTGTGIGPDGGLINDGKWHYVAFTVDNSGGTIYVDGVQKASLPWTGTPGASTSTIPVTVGVYQGVQGDPQSYFRGLMDEVSIWNVARTQADIQASMTKLLTGSEAGLAAGFGFDEDAGPAANDRTSNGRTGYLTNGAAWVPSTIPVVDAWANVRDALRITGGFAAASPADISRLDIEAGGGINLADAIRLARKATGLAN